MGTDINMYAEVKRDGRWQLIGGLEENRYYFPDDYPNAQRYKPVEIYDVRNYDLFGILADVRNPNGRTRDNQKFEVISPQRGLPNDLSPELNSWREYWQDDMICPSWLYLSEILRFDWDGKFMPYEAMVEAHVAHLFEEHKPFPFDRWPKNLPISYGVYIRDGVKVRWTDSYATAVGKEFLNAMHDLKKHGKPSRVRIVFWFDW